jgi:hypothetical protein
LRFSTAALEFLNDHITGIADGFEYRSGLASMNFLIDLGQLICTAAVFHLGVYTSAIN